MNTENNNFDEELSLEEMLGEAEADANNPDKQPVNMLQALETIVSEANDCELSAAYFEKVHEETELIGGFYHLTPAQVVFLGLMIDCPHPLSKHNISRYVNCCNIRLLTLEDDLDELVDRKFCRKLQRKEDGSMVEAYSVCREFVDAIKNAAPFQPRSLSGLTRKEFMEELTHLVEELEDDQISTDTFVQLLHYLKMKNPELVFCKALDSYNLSEVDCAFLMFNACNYLCTYGEDDTSFNYMQFFDKPLERRAFMKPLFKGENELIQKDLLELGCENGVADLETLSLTLKAKMELFADMNLDFEDAAPVKMKGLMNVDSIPEKVLFYNKDEELAVSRLETLIKNDQFTLVQERLKASGMRTGFAVLLYGGPGTGKTETVMQLAKKTGRDLFPVNVAAIRDKFVGESEKKLRGVFREYHLCCQKNKLAPILFFNEADSIIGKRRTDVNSSVDQMDNALQNILLEEIERLDGGILIATTNLTEVMDKAFERRFLYKIHFQKPDLKARTSIWQSMLPELTDEDAQKLAKGYDFSGGQIENVARKQLVDGILFAKPLTYDGLKEYCDTELIEKSTGHRIGFC